VKNMDEYEKKQLTLRIRIFSFLAIFGFIFITLLLSIRTVNAGEVAGMPVNPAPQIAPNRSAPSAEFNIPAGAIQKLKSNPALREAFDAKYGQGASAKILGK
jgi:hypothetical protein